MPEDTDTEPSAASKLPGERIAKRMARAGVCSRRDAERMITEGRVSLNGRKLDSPAINVTANDIVTVDGKVIAEAERTRLWRYHKPNGLVTTHRDPEGRQTLFETLPPELGRVISVGRLDLTSEGLLLLTNDGALARRLELPATGWLRRYRVRVHGSVDPNRLLALADGIVIDGVRYGAIEATLDKVQGRNAWLTVSLREGKNREIRKIAEHIGLEVTRLIRVAYGPFQLGALEERGIEEVPPKVLRDQLGVGPAPERSRARVASQAVTAEPPAPEGAARKPRPRRWGEDARAAKPRAPRARRPTE